MTYTISGTLSGYLCDECWEWLEGVVVRFYPAAGDQVVARAAADPKDTLTLLDEPRAGNPVGEATVGADGAFTVELVGDYGGGALDVDLYCGTLPHGKVPHKVPGPVTLHLTTLQPRWRDTRTADGAVETGAPTERPGDQVAAFEYAVPRRWWCLVRARLGGWTLCGHVTVCATGAPVAGVTVRAFDVDWLQDDPLGSAVTDSAGHYRIDYTIDDFTRTPLSPWINLELVPGPDVYFRVESGGSPVLVEPRSAGRTPSRQNIGPCACIDLCLDGEVPPSTPPTIPMFTDVGAYSIKPSDGAFAPDGTTTAGNLAFTGDIPLLGIVPDPLSPDAVEYRFLVAEGGGPPSPVTAAAMEPTVIGKLQYFAWDAILSVWQATWTDFWANRPGTTVSIPQQAGPDLVVPVNTDVAADGWIAVPRTNGLYPTGPGRFLPMGELARLKTTAYTDESFDLSATGPGLPVEAGDPVPAAQQSAMPTFTIDFEARKVVGHAAVGADSLATIAFSNVADTYVRHPYWAGGPVTSTGVASLGIGEMVSGGGCAELGDTIHVLYTSYHPYSGQPTVYFDGNPILPAPLTPALTNGLAVSAPGGDVVDISLLAKCAYVLWLEVPLRLTSGYGSIGAHVQDHLAFCKQ